MAEVKTAKKRGRPKKSKKAEEQTTVENVEEQQKEQGSIFEDINDEDLKGMSFDDLGLSNNEPGAHEPTAETSSSQILKVQDLLLENIEPSPWNPNRQSDAIFNQLVESIDESGFDEPIIVVPHPEKDGKYRIIGGEHRWRAMKTLGSESIPAIIKDWDTLKQKVETVKRNILHGELDNTLFTNLVNDIMKNEEIDLSAVSGLMGFDDFGKFAAHYIQQEEEEETGNKITTLMENAEEELADIDNLSLILNMLFSHYGNTLPANFMYFMFRKKLHYYLKLDKVGKKATDLLAAYFIDQGDSPEEKTRAFEGDSVNKFLQDAIIGELEKRGADISLLTQKAKGIEKLMKEPDPSNIDK